MGKVSRVEPEDCILVDASDSLKSKLQQIGWLEFIKKFHGYNLEMTKQFAATFDGRKAIIGNLELTVDQETLAAATGFPNAGEEWFKGRYDKNNFHWNHFFKRNAPREFGKGLALCLLKKKYCEFMFIILDYITCEGRYSLLLAFHVKLLMVSDGRAINLPYYLLKSLGKMSKAYQRTTNPQSLFHHGLICIVLKHELIKYHLSWDRFLSKIQINDDEHIRNYSLPVELETNEHPQNNDHMPEDFEKFDSDSHDQNKVETSFANKRNARLASRLVRNQTKKQDTPELVDLDQEEVPTFSVARAVIDLNQPPPKSPLSEKAIPDHDLKSESSDSPKDAKCKSCCNYEIQIQSLKDDVSELHKEILKLKRQKRLMTKNYEMEVADLNKKLKKNESDPKYHSSRISIVINSEGQSTAKNKEK